MILLNRNIYPVIMLFFLSIFLISCSSDDSSSEPNIQEVVVWENFINQNNILSSVYDKDNNSIWIGTDNGLLKLDATDIENLTIDESFLVEDGLLSNEIYSIMLNESKNEIWLGTHYGISVYDLSDKTFSSIIMEERLYSNHINIMQKDISTNQIYVGTDDGINIYDGNNDIWSVFRFETGFSENVINDICLEVNESGINDIWFATNGGAFKKDNNLDEWVSFTENDGLIDNEVLSIGYDDLSLNVYLGTKSGVSVLDTDDNSYTFGNEITMENGLSNNTINDILVFEIHLDDNNSSRGSYIYFATDNGLNLFSSNNITSYYEEEDFSSTMIKNILLLDLNVYDNTILCGTNYGLSSLKVDLINKDILLSYKYFYGPYIYTNDVMHMPLIGSEGNILFFTSSKGLISYDTAINKWEYYYNENEIPDDIESIYIDNSNNIWVGTNNGVYKYDLTNFTLYNEDNSELPGDRVYSIFRDRDNFLWFGTNKGLAKFNELSNEWIIYDEENSGLPYKKVYDITYDSADNNFWFGTKRGLAKFDGFEEWIVYDEENGLTNEDIEKLQFDNNGNLWIIHDADDEDIKLTKFNQETDIFETISASSTSLINDNVYSIYFDSSNNELYFGTDAGVCSYNINSEIWKQYENSFETKIYGMQLVENNNEEKEMWLSTDNGVSVMRDF